MSLSRLALRLAAIEALTPSAALSAGGPFPTLAGNRVDDSRVDLIANAQSPEELEAALNALENKPLLIVYTEEQHSAPYGEVKFPAKENIVTLVVEAMIGAKGMIEIGQLEGPPIELGTLDAPITDRQHEATLDFLESQVRFLFDRSNRAPSADLFNKVAWEVRTTHSDPQRAADRTVRLASRTIKFHVKVAAEVWPVAPASGFPEPLATVAAALPAGSSGANLLDALAGFAPVAPAIPVPGRDGALIEAAISRGAAPPLVPADVTAFVSQTP